MTPGIHRLAVPTPYAIGDANTYLIEDEPLTLVDTGPGSTGAFDALAAGLAEHGRSLGEIELVLVTHEHLDHIGLAREIVEHSGARVACLDRLATYAANFGSAAAADRAFAGELMRANGVDDATVERHGAPVPAREMSFDTDIVLQEGSTIELRDRRLRVLHAPGHSATDTLFHDEQSGALFAGDHLLPTVSSNALVASRPFAPDGAPRRPERRRALVEYLESLARTRELELDVVLGGHGDPIADHRALVDERVGRIEARAMRIAGLLGGAPRSAHELAVALWGAVATAQPYLTLSEVLGHLDLLVDAGAAVEHDDGGVAVFAGVG